MGRPAGRAQQLFVLLQGLLVLSGSQQGRGQHALERDFLAVAFQGARKRCQLRGSATESGTTVLVATITRNSSGGALGAKLSINRRQMARYDSPEPWAKATHSTSEQHLGDQRIRGVTGVRAAVDRFLLGRVSGIPVANHFFGGRRFFAVR